MVTDPVADMITRIRNGYRARLERVDVPGSQLKTKLAEILKKEGFISDYRVINDNLQGIIEVKLRYTDEREPVVQGIKRVSRPGLRRYFGAKDIPKVRNGLGTLILTTSKGLMTDREARNAHIGGEALCAVW